MTKTEYHIIDVDFSGRNNIDLELLALQVDNYNHDMRFLHYMYQLKPNVMRFFHVFQYNPKSDKILEEIQEVQNIFETNIECYQKLVSDLTCEELKVMGHVQKLLISRSWDKNLVYSLKSSEEVLADVAEMTGFSEFKTFFFTLHHYVQNIKARGINANFNVVLVQNEEIDSSQFIRKVYELYVAEGIIINHVLYNGNVSEAIHEKDTSRYLYNIEEDWDIFDSGGGFFRVTSTVEAFQKLVLNDTIYITTMEESQYQKALEIDSFRSMFPHAVVIGNLSPEDKLQIIVKRAREYGLLMNIKSLQNSLLLKEKPLTFLLAEVDSIAQRTLSGTESKSAPIAAEDFGGVMGKPEIDPYKELDALVGLDEVKERVKEIVAFLKKAGIEALPCLHMVFRGNPGTGKTTIARLIGKIFAQEGIIKRKDVFVETDREGLIARYVGHTAKQTSSKIKEAMGGILFIDEAYALGIYEKGHDFGEEAISTLVKRMEDYRKDFVCIMTGYTDEMDKMLQINPGLRDRVQYYIDFPDYNTAELVQIFYGFCREKELGLSRAAEESLYRYFNQIVDHKDEHFSNARLVRKVFERVWMKHVVGNDGNTLVEKTIHAVFQERDMNKLLLGGNSSLIGFS